MKNPKFSFFQRPNGHVEFLEFLETIPKKDREKMLATIGQVQTEGLLVARKMQWIKKIDDDLFELRSKIGNNIQRGLYFHATGNEMIITHGFTKKTQKTPANQVKHAHVILHEYKEERLNDNH